MHRPIAVVDAHEKNCLDLCSALEDESYPTCSFNALTNLEAAIEEDGCWLAILDLDSLPVDNLFFQKIKRKNPALIIIALSSRSYHPELEEAMRTHIYACLGKPVKEEELLFLIRSWCGR
jgi:DNA-binding NtrC family response regulator